LGEAKRRRQNSVSTVYHHTSTLRTNLIWMSGVVQVEGKSDGAFHPQLGEIKTDALARRDLKEFPPVAWFTTRVETPRCLIDSRFFFISKKTGEKMEIEVDVKMAHAIALNRVALGFPIADVPVVPWPEYRGYVTREGQELNESAREAGDDPDHWYISEDPIDVLKMSELWLSPRMLKPKLKRFDDQLPHIKRMVSLCREKKGVYIPPTWLTPEQGNELARQLGVPILNYP